MGTSCERNSDSDELDNRVVETHATALLAERVLCEAEHGLCAREFGGQRYLVISEADWTLLQGAFDRLIADVKSLDLVYRGADLAAGGRCSPEARKELFGVLASQTV